MKQQNALRAQLEREFKVDPNHPKAQLCFETAWECGHFNPEHVRKLYEALAKFGKLIPDDVQ